MKSRIMSKTTTASALTPRALFSTGHTKTAGTVRNRRMLPLNSIMTAAVSTKKTNNRIRRMIHAADFFAWILFTPHIFSQKGCV